LYCLVLFETDNISGLTELCWSAERLDLEILIDPCEPFPVGCLTVMDLSHTLSDMLQGTYPFARLHTITLLDPNCITDSGLISFPHPFANQHAQRQDAWESGHRTTTGLDRQRNLKSVVTVLM
jgi:hypothetical protein